MACRADESNFQTLMVPAPERPQATIIGAGGFVGRALHAKLQSLGWSCTIPNRHAEWAPRGPLGHIFYCAGLTADYAERPTETVEAHVGLLSRVLASPNWESLVYLSSTRLYDGQPRDRSGAEDGGFVVDPENARHLYDLSKLLGENLCRVMGHGKARVARLSCVYCDENDPDGFIGNLMQKVLNAAAGSILPIDSSPHFERDYVHLDDVVEALVHIAQSGRSQVYNVAFGENVPNSELADVIYDCAAVHLAFTRTDTSDRSPVVQNWRLAEEFAWAPRSLEQALRAWAAKHGRSGGG